ncbi:MAG: hypothetical protein Q8P93_00350 [bacterium]|nr:hypothetical protein [bacterium]
MKKGLIWLIVILIAATLLIVWLPNMANEEPMGEQDGSAIEEELLQNDTNTEETEAVTVRYTDTGFEPNEVRVSSGQTITFINESSRSMWPASAAHPTHTVYPGSDIQKCGTADAAMIFDACGDSATYSFAFTQVGDWKYHNHLVTSHGGTIIVE